MNNARMKTLTPSTISRDLMVELQNAAEKAAKGSRDPEAMRKASQDMDRLSEPIRRKYGVLDIGVPAIRELRE